MKRSTLLFTAASSLSALVGCSSSLVYAPAIHVSEQPLAAQDVELRAAVSALPETRPHHAEHKTALGGSAEIGYGFTDDFSLYLCGWMAFQNNAYNTVGSARVGYALSSRIALLRNDRYELLLYPRAAMVFDRSTAEGYGFELPVVFLRRFSQSATGVYAYAGAGFAYGVHNKLVQPPYSAESGEERPEAEYPNGYAIIGHIGIGWNISTKFRLTGEVNPILQINSFEDEKSAIFAPSIGLAYTFK